MRKFIIGSDWWTDCDDAVAMRILARAHLKGEIEILGIGINACMEHSVSSISAFLHYEGIDNIPIGLDRQATDFGRNPPYQKRLALSLIPPLQTNDTALDAVELYIKLLKESNEKVEIIEIGYPQVLAGVLKREPQLFNQKVEKIWMMAGKWDEDLGKENNFARNQRSQMAGHYLCENCEVPITFLGWEIGNTVLTGGKLQAEDQLHKALCDTGYENGRSSWDPMLVLMAVIGDEQKSGYRKVQGSASVNAETGENSFIKSETGKHCYVVKNYPDDFYKDAIDNLIQ